MLVTIALMLTTVVSSYYWQGQQTANGERFNPSANTCAHKTLPFGTMLRLERQGNVVHCRVNDRGPFIRGRDLDVSRGVAQKLNLIGVGVGAVNMQVVGAGISILSTERSHNNHTKKHTPHKLVKHNLSPDMSHLLRRMEARFGKIEVISGYRAGAIIAGTNRISKHASGNAVDFVVTKDRRPEILKWLRADKSVGSVITYSKMGHIHVDVGSSRASQSVVDRNITLTRDEYRRIKKLAVRASWRHTSPIQHWNLATTFRYL